VGGYNKINDIFAVEKKKSKKGKKIWNDYIPVMKRRN